MFIHTINFLGCFDWLKRMKVAVEFARVLAFFHAPKKCFLPYGPYLIRNVDATHIMLDKVSFGISFIIDSSLMTLFFS